MAFKVISQDVLEGLPLKAQAAISQGKHNEAAGHLLRLRMRIPQDLLDNMAEELKDKVPPGWGLEFENYLGRVRAVCFRTPW